MVQLDTAFNLLRHVTKPFIDGLIHDILHSPLHAEQAGEEGVCSEGIKVVVEEVSAPNGVAGVEEAEAEAAGEVKVDNLDTDSHASVPEEDRCPNDEDVPSPLLKKRRRKIKR